MDISIGDLMRLRVDHTEKTACYYILAHHRIFDHKPTLINGAKNEVSSNDEAKVVGACTKRKFIDTVFNKCIGEPNFKGRCRILLITPVSAFCYQRITHCPIVKMKMDGVPLIQSVYICHWQLKKLICTLQRQTID
ncbi:MAG: hypothetical protein CL852_01365 [Crocinitomicaceae bacterium]|nr:hypothetical protein [Crocinitomicaceae bacterium]